MNIGVAYADRSAVVWRKLVLPEGSTVRDAIDESGLLAEFPEIDLSSQKVGIFGKVTKLDAVLEDGARVEIYHPIIADPEDDEDDED